MWFSSNALLPVLLALETAAAALPKTISRDHGWEKRSLAPPDSLLKLHIALKQADNGARVEQVLLSISDPNSPQFRQYIEAEEAPLLAAPAQDSVQAVESWLQQHDMFSNATLSNGIFEVDTTVRQAERLLNTTYFVFTDGTQKIIRNELFYFPDSVLEHIDLITPTTMFPKPAKWNVPHDSTPSFYTSTKVQEPVLGKRDSCGANDFVTPTCVRKVYDIDYQAKPNRTTFAVYGTEAASFSSTDLNTYLLKFNEPAASAGATFTVVGKGDSSESSGIEAKFETALDTQTLLGLAWPAKGILYNNGGVFGPNPGQTYDNFVNFLQQLITNKTVPSVVSFSESMPEDMMDSAYAKRLCNMMAQVGARGVTLLFSSGDNGPNGDQPSGTHKKIFEPEFPSSCSWVTAVGGTTNLADETAATKSTISVVGKLSYTASGGGFSNLFKTPSYQTAAVQNYTTNHIPESYHSVPGFNAKGRGIPDISAFSTNFPTVVDYITIPIGGTSASTPLWAAIVTLLNDYEASKGRPALGFLNPWLYSLTSCLKDIKTGGNNAGSCDVLSGCKLSKTLGYNVTAGWDPVTGLGSPIFTELTKALDAQAKKSQSTKRLQS